MNDLTLYNAVRPFIKTGDFLDWDSHTPLGETIQAFTGGDGNHGCLVDRMSGLAGDRLYTLEALGGPFRPYYLSLRLQEHRGRVWWYPLCDAWDTIEIRTRICRDMYAQIGKGYDYPALLINAIRKVSADDSLLFCYEAVFMALGFHGKVPVTGNDMAARLKIFKEPVRIL